MRHGGGRDLRLSSTLARHGSHVRHLQTRRGRAGPGRRDHRAASSARVCASSPLEFRTLDRETLGRHYEEHEGKGFYDDLVAFMTRGPAVVLVLEGPQDTFKVVRTMMGSTNPRDAAPGTIRGDLGIELTENLVHGSDSPESAAREIAIFFPNL